MESMPFIAQRVHKSQMGTRNHEQDSLLTKLDKE
jgi:hypothetical protein